MRASGTRSVIHTSLGPAGDDFIAGFTAEPYRQFMRDWEARMNYDLSSGTALSGKRLV